MAREDRATAKAAKAATKAEAKANKKPGRFAQIRQIYRRPARVDPAITWWMLGVASSIIAVFAAFGVLIGHWLYFTIISIPFAVLAADDRHGAAGRARGVPADRGPARRLGCRTVGALRRGWYYDKEPVAAEATRPGDFTSAALVFRAIGRPGVDPGHRGTARRGRPRLVDSERKRVNRVAPNVPVHVLRTGNGEDEVPVRKLAKKISRMRPELTKPEVDAVNKRLKALGGVKMPVPKGMDPTKARPDRRAMRGR